MAAKAILTPSDPNYQNLLEVVGLIQSIIYRAEAAFYVQKIFIESTTLLDKALILSGSDVNLMISDTRNENVH